MKVDDAQPQGPTPRATGVAPRQEREAPPSQGRRQDGIDSGQAHAGKALGQGLGLDDAARGSADAAVATPQGVTERAETDAALLSVFTAACVLVDRDGPLFLTERLRDPLCVAVDAARGMTAAEAIADRARREER